MRAVLMILSLIASPLAAQDNVADFFGMQGCAVGPFTKELAMEAGFDGPLIAAWIASDGSAETQGDWTILSPDICQITLPEISSPLSLSDPEVQPFISDIDAYEEPQDAGCFLDGIPLMQDLINTRGWDEERAFDAYITLLASGLISGELRFYSEDILRTPPGFRVTTGACGAVAMIDDIRDNHVILTASFAPFMRQIAAHVACEEGATLFNPESQEVIDRISDGQNKNAWLFFEYQIIAIAAGWYEGAGYSEKGTPRPPVCRVQ